LNIGQREARGIKNKNKGARHPAVLIFIQIRIKREEKDIRIKIRKATFALILVY